METVLAIEDCEDQQRLIAQTLAGECSVEAVGTLGDARSSLSVRLPDIILLDVGLPDGDGFRFCAELQDDPRTQRIPVIFLTSRHEAADKAMGFSLGAEDFVEKPCEPVELRARVRARLRRAGRAEEVLRKGSLELQAALYRAFHVDDSGERRELELTPKEFRLLHLLARDEGRVFTRRQILEALWGDVVVSERTVDTHLSNLRGKLGVCGSCLQAVRGAGYRFVRS